MDTNRSFLILWDVDHTLVDVGDISRAIYKRAFHAVFGRQLQDLAGMTGRTESAILADTLALHEISASADVVDAFYFALARAAEDLRDRMLREGRCLPGAPKAISSLVDDNVVQTLVTGNLRPIATTKLEVFGLAEHIDFDVGGYGADGDTRPPLIRCALQRAEAKYGDRFTADRVVVIGDTPFDISGARAVGVHAVGVATGGNTVADLVAAGADAVVSDLTDVDLLRAAVFERALRR